jgi:hypothetical protein
MLSAMLSLFVVAGSVGASDRGVETLGCPQGTIEAIMADAARPGLPNPGLTSAANNQCGVRCGRFYNRCLNDCAINPHDGCEQACAEDYATCVEDCLYP